MSEIDLNDEKVVNYGELTPFLPWANGRYVARFLDLRLVKGETGKRAYLARLEIGESSNPDVRVGELRALRFGLDGDAVAKSYAAKKLRALVLALEDQTGNREADGNAGLDKWITKGEAAAEEWIYLEIVATTRTTTNGKPVTDYFFRRIVG